MTLTKINRIMRRKNDFSLVARYYNDYHFYSVRPFCSDHINRAQAIRLLKWHKEDRVGDFK